MELRDFRYFVTLAEALHFGRAAERLQITQPALSRRIRALETELEVELFHRTKRSVELTMAGKTFLIEAHQTLQQAQQAALNTRQVARGEKGQLRLSFTASALRSVVPQIVRVFRERCPDVQLAMTEYCTHDQVEAFCAHRIDVGFLYPPVDKKLLITMPLYDEAWVVALPKGHPLALKQPLKLSDLADESFILHPRWEGSSFYDRIIKLCQQAGFQPNVVQEVAASQTRVGLVGVGLGITFVPEALMHQENSAIAYRRLQGAAPSLQLALAYRCDSSSPIVRRFCETVGETIRYSP